MNNIETVKYSKSLKLVNIEQLPKGLKCKYLECSKHDDEIGTTLVAYKWRRKLPVGIDPWHIIVIFGEG